MHGESSGLFALPSPNETSTHPPCRSPGAHRGFILPLEASGVGPALHRSLQGVTARPAAGARPEKFQRGDCERPARTSRAGTPGARSHRVSRNGFSALDERRRCLQAFLDAPVRAQFASASNETVGPSIPTSRLASLGLLFLRAAGSLLPGGLALLGGGSSRRPLGRLALFGRRGGRRLGAGGLLRLLAQARLQSLHQVDDLPLGGLGGCDRYCLPLGFAVDDLLYPLSIFVLVFLGLEGIGRQLPNELHRQLQLRLSYVRVPDRHVGEGANLVRVAQLLHHQPVLERPNEHQGLAAARGVLGDRALLGLPHRLAQEPKRPLAALFGAEVVSALEVQRIHLFGGNELSDLDCLRGGILERLQLVLVEDDVLILGELVALYHVVPRNRLVILRADVLLLQARVALFVQEVERDSNARLVGGVKLDGNRDEAE